MRKVAILAILLGLTFVGCASTPSGSSIIAEQTGANMVVTVVDLGEIDEDLSVARVIVRNNTDRAVTADFEAGRHYDLNVGDRREARLDVTPGSYTIRASAPSFATTSVNARLAGDRSYEVRISDVRHKPQ